MSWCGAVRDDDFVIVTKGDLMGQAWRYQLHMKIAEVGNLAESPCEAPAGVQVETTVPLPYR